MANSIGNVNVQPYWLKTPDRYMIDQERLHHNEAVYAYGEYSFFFMFWGIDDFREGTVDRCPYCYDSDGGINSDIADVYGQGAEALCPYCYGTTYWKTTATALPGLKARIVRPCMWNTTDEIHKKVAQGNMTEVTSQVQSISDFRMRSGDFVLRADKTRWRVQPRKTDLVISGFQAADDINAMIGYNYPEVRLEDPTSVAYQIPPNNDDAQSILNISTVPNYPIDFSSYEVINGPLIGGAFANTPTVGPSFEQP